MFKDGKDIENDEVFDEKFIKKLINILTNQ